MSLFYLKERDALETKNAGSKARLDVETIAESVGYQPIDVVLPYKKNKGILRSLIANVRIARFFQKRLSGLIRGDKLLVQFPPRSHSVFFPILFHSLRNRGVEVTFLIHDLDRMRYSQLKDVPLKKRFRIFVEESLLLQTADKQICHNQKMKCFLLGQKIPADQLISLDIWDYLTNCPLRTQEAKEERNRVIIAGNLSPEKCVYISDLQNVPNIEFQLYGVGYQDLNQPNVTYHGSFQPDELVGNLTGDFGLVWDGDSIDTCTGIFGNYLRLNNPHKLSLYLTAGIPVIVWDEAAVADYVRLHNVGLIVSSLKDISGCLDEMTQDEYTVMANNAAEIARKLREGFHLKQALLQ